MTRESIQNNLSKICIELISKLSPAILILDLLKLEKKTEQSVKILNYLILNFFKLKFILKKFKILQKTKKRLVIFTQGIFLPILKKIRKLIAELQVLPDGRTDRPTDSPRQ